jgi:hemerythrin
MTAGVGNIDVGNRAMDDDHHALAELIEKVGNICEFSAMPVRDCDQCAQGKSRICFDSLTQIAHEVMVRMIEHFHREDDLMKSLPANPVTMAHCAGHRREHVAFSTRYNRIAAQVSDDQPFVGLCTLNAFILDWARSTLLSG